MIIVGAGNLGKLILDQMLMDKQIVEADEVVFFDEKTSEEKVFGKYQIISKLEDLQQFCAGKTKEYFVAIGNSRIREKMDTVLRRLHATPISILSDLTKISEFSIINKHLYISYCSGILHSCQIGYSNIIHSGVLIAHGVKTGDFVNICANANLCADCVIGDYTFIGTNAIVLPNIIVGRNCYITAGAVIGNNMSDYETK